MADDNYLPCNIKAVINLTDSVNNWDCICIIDSSECKQFNSQFAAQREIDNAFDSEVTCFKSPELNCRVVHSPLGVLTDYDDVRTYERAASKAIGRAIKAGSKAPLLVLPSSKVKGSNRFENADLCSLLGALGELYVPIQLREDVPEKEKRIKQLGVLGNDQKHLNEIIGKAIQFEHARFVARDIGVGDPERMAPPRVIQYLHKLFDNSNIKMNVISDPKIFAQQYPLYEAVNRAASAVPRHNGHIAFMEYVPPKPVRKTLLFVGKGVTYDTGGADIKAGGVMAGMSRDKCGAATVAGLMKFVSDHKPEDVHVIGVMCMVRNSVGEECYVADEVITSRAGVRVRVGNTDAEGRMAMTDVLCEMKERAVNLTNPHLFTIATLTGHACLAVGDGYSIVMDNGPARDSGHGLKLQQEGERIGNPFEISILQKEDFSFHRGVVIGEDTVQSNNLPSTRTPRGHQTPAAFMILSSGLDKHGGTSEKPLKYSHLDIAASAGTYPFMPTGAPILAIANTHIL